MLVSFLTQSKNTLLLMSVAFIIWSCLNREKTTQLWVVNKLLVLKLEGSEWSEVNNNISVTITVVLVILRWHGTERAGKDGRPSICWMVG